MKHTISSIVTVLILSIFFLANQVAAQTRQPREMWLRGPQEPISKDYQHYTTYSLDFKFPENLIRSMANGEQGKATQELQQILGFSGLTLANDGEFKVVYTISKFAYLGSDTDRNISKHRIGFQGNVVVSDKEGKVIYTRHMPANVKEYHADITSQPAFATFLATRYNFVELMSDFETYYLYGPVMKLNFVELKMPRKNIPAAVVDFNQSSEVFKNINAVQRTEWPKLFEVAQTYWKDLMAFKDSKDDDAIKDVRLGAAINLASSYLMLNNLEEAEKLLPFIKENDRKMLGSTQYHNTMNDAINYVKEQRTNTELKSNITLIETPPAERMYKNPGDIFEYLPLAGSLVTKKDGTHEGNIRLMYNRPVVITVQAPFTEVKQSGLGMAVSLLGSMSTDNSTVYVDKENVKKPTKLNINDITEVRTTDGKVYATGIIGFALSEDKRYSLVEKIEDGKNLELYQEIFPGNAIVFKRPGAEKFTQIIQSGIGYKKMLKNQFKDCPGIHTRIDSGEFNSFSQNTYIRLMKAYNEAGCNN